jgi:AcrR family transcriptional regulator
MSTRSCTPAHRDRAPPEETKEGRYHHGDLRAALLAAAEAELAQRGIEKFSLRGVAKRAGVSHAAPAHHFGDADGLLTALAALAFDRFVATQRAAMAQAAADPASQLAASGLGYVRFALANPALFRLIFSSDRPDFDSAELERASTNGFELLASQVMEVTGRSRDDPALIQDIAAAWCMAHGLADLLAAGRLKTVVAMPAQQREAMILALVRRSLAGAMD